MAKPSHQPFEDWLLSEATLSLEEMYLLQEHLHACAACRELSLALREMERALRSAPWVAPADGFVNRWEQRLEVERQKWQRRQTWWMLTFSLGGAALLLGLTLALISPLIRQPLPLILAWIYRLVVIITTAEAAGEVARTLIGTLFLAIPPWIWLGVAGTLTLLGVLWLATLQRLVATRRFIL